MVSWSFAAPAGNKGGWCSRPWRGVVCSLVNPFTITRLTLSTHTKSPYTHSLPRARMQTRVAPRVPRHAKEYLRTGPPRRRFTLPCCPALVDDSLTSPAGRAACRVVQIPVITFGFPSHVRDASRNSRCLEVNIAPVRKGSSHNTHATSISIFRRLA